MCALSVKRHVRLLKLTEKTSLVQVDNMKQFIKLGKARFTNS